MDRNTAPGTKVKYLGNTGYRTDRDVIEAKGVIPGQIVEVERVVVDKWRADFKLVGIEGVYSAVMFGEIL